MKFLFKNVLLEISAINKEIEHSTLFFNSPSSNNINKKNCFPRVNLGALLTHIDEVNPLSVIFDFIVNKQICIKEY